MEIALLYKIMLSYCTGRTIDGKRDVKEDGAVLQIPEFVSDSVDSMFRYMSPVWH